MERSPGLASTSATLGAYTTYIDSLHRNSYAAYIRLQELERAWGLWHFTSPTQTMPCDRSVPLGDTTPILAPAPGPLYRLAPALGALELTMRLLVDFMEVNLDTIDQPLSPRRPHRSYVYQSTRLDGWTRNLNAQLQLMRSIIDMDDSTDVDSDYLLTTGPSATSLAQPHHWWWHTEPTNAALLARLQSLMACHFQGLPFGPGILTSHERVIPYDDVVLPRHVRTTCREADAEFVEDHFFATVHQIVEAWCCAMERQLDAAQADIDDVTRLATTPDMTSSSPAAALQRIARRYRWCSHAWEYLIDHITLLSEMDARDYLSLKFHLHGASGGQSVRLRMLTARIPHLFPWPVPAAVSPAPFDPSDWSHVVAVLAQVQANVETIPLQAELVALFHAHVSPASDAVQLLQAVQMLENAVRRFYFGHQQLAIMVLGADASGTQELTVKALERGWKTSHRYLCCEHAKEVLSKQLSAAQSSDVKGRIIRRETQSALDRHDLTVQCGHVSWEASVEPTSPMAQSQREGPPSPKLADRFHSPYRAAFARSLALLPPQTLHFSTYGMGLAPDMSLASVQHTHTLLASNLNELWPRFFAEDLPAAERVVLTSLGLPQSSRDGQSLCYHVNFGANVHEFLVRLFSCLRPPLSIVTSDAEFVSLTRQVAAWDTTVHVHAVPLRPFASFGDRLRSTVAEVAPQVVHISAIYSNSQYRVPDADIAALVAAVPPSVLVILDVAQALQNVPLALPAARNFVVVGSGVKHATAGPGLGFVAFPRNGDTDESPIWTPTNTGWIAYLPSMTTPPTTPVQFTPELVFAGGTPGFHYPLRQLNDIDAFYASQGPAWSLASRHAYILDLQAHFFNAAASMLELASVDEARRRAPENRSNAIVLAHPQAQTIYSALTTPSSQPGRVVCHCDVRLTTHLRLGFGLHHVRAEVETLAQAIVQAWTELATSEKFQLVY
ncbi:Aste57867_24233 [Aphanomyces stellatus]|uniref:Aste57867_24233 protein n=1 Tax=Aphanomyces stellatus TaxID=120398 RepID=A0A485LPU5_9STRA|nr:hypothetical protein As57867_024158 [Aphanomyces stellatus]VFU00874.1 Aste57867_24233 [Aphanomyces stellatus]